MLNRLVEILMQDKVEIGVKTDVGRVRSENQDHFDVWRPEDDSAAREKGYLVVVADGMGGHSGGMIASQTAVAAFVDAYRASGERALRSRLDESFSSANGAVRSKAQADPQVADMGTTCVTVAVRGGIAMIGHLGDSRCYFIRDGVMEQVTRDHTYLNELIDIGLMTSEQADGHPDKNIITRCIGMAERIEVDFNKREVKAGDVFVLCSDGLTNFVTDDEIRDVALEEDAESGAKKLIDMANAGGGDDNITVAILKIHGDLEQDQELMEMDSEEFSSELTPVISREITARATSIADDEDTDPGLDTTVESPIGDDDTTPVSPIPATDPHKAIRSSRAWFWIIGAEILALIILQVVLLGY